MRIFDSKTRRREGHTPVSECTTLHLAVVTHFQKFEFPAAIVQYAYFKESTVGVVVII